MPSTLPRFLVVDQSLKDFEGHHYDYSRAVIEAASKQGFAVMLAPNRAFPGQALEGAPIVGGFTGSWNEAGYSTARGMTRKILASLPQGARQLLLRAATVSQASAPMPPVVSDHRFAQELVALLAVARMGETDHTLVHTISEAEFLGLADHLASRAPLPGLLHIILRYEGTAASTRAFDKLDQVTTRVRIWTDTEPLAKHYRDIGATKIGVLPIPHGLDAFPKRGEKRDQALTLAYLGGARRDKGFDQLPGLIASLAQDYLSTGHVRLLVQSNYSLSRDEPLMARTRRELARFPREWVELIDAPLNREDFQTALFSSDILLLPYLTETYRRRSSGLLIQAMVAGIPAVLPEGTWLATEAPAAANVLFGTKVSFAEAVRHAIVGHASLASAACAATHDHRDRHNARRFVRMMVDGR